MDARVDIRLAPRRSRAVLLIPNLLTGLRLVLGLIFPLLPPSLWLPAFLTATATEALDGLLARRLQATSTFGQVLDPIADKIFVIAVLATLATNGLFSLWMLPLIAARDLLVLVGGFWVMTQHGLAGLHRMPPTLLGKLATAAQFLLMLTLLVRMAPVDSWPLGALVAITAVLSLAAGVDYLRRYE